FEENAVLKAIAGFAHTQMACLADDSGLEVAALSGAPGVWSARYAGPDATDALNHARLMRELAALPGATRDARFVSCVAVALPAALAGRVAGTDFVARPIPGSAGGVVVTAQRHVSGVIIDDPRGEGGFGYDPHFLYEPL